jgi:hypothetical protein
VPNVQNQLVPSTQAHPPQASLQLATIVTYWLFSLNFTWSNDYTYHNLMLTSFALATWFDVAALH